MYIPFQRNQYPIQLAFAFTMNKSQGQTLSKMGLYLPGPVFAHGQLYTGLSRIENQNNIKILIINSDKHGEFDGYDGVYTKNEVYKQALNGYMENNSNISNVEDIENTNNMDDIELKEYNSIDIDNDNDGTDDSDDNQDNHDNDDQFYADIGCYIDDF